MDDLKRRINGSLRLRLSLWLAFAICCIAVLAGAFAFYAAFRQAHTLQDDMLRQVAALAARQPLSGAVADDAGMAGNSDNSDNRVYVQALGVPAPTALPLPADLPDGLQTVRAGGETYRVMVRRQHGQHLAVAQETSVRDETARDSALLALIPLLILVPVLLLVVTELVRKAFLAVHAVASAADARGEHDLSALPGVALPAEIRPFVEAINRLLLRLRIAMEEQRRFIADAAHELRTPLTALSLQAELVAAVPLPEQAASRLAVLRQGIERSRLLLNQLLSLARVQQADSGGQAHAVSVQQVYRQVLEDLMPLADAKRIDMGVIDTGDMLVCASAIDLETVLNNLVGNAIAYTPEGGRIDLALQPDGTQAIVVVADNGPGIDGSERERVFEPFYRIAGNDQPGAGLGLAIVRAVCERIGATITLSSATPAGNTGLRVEIRLPAVTAGRQSEIS